MTQNVLFCPEDKTARSKKSKFRRFIKMGINY